MKDVKVPKNVFLLGLVSFFNDIASEMIYPIVPIFLTSVLGTPLPIIGLIEGIAEATASVSKFLFGYVSDFTQKRKPFVIAGYAFGAASKVLIGLASSWPLVLFARFIDRTGKGLRTAARDSMLLENATQTNRGFIFGFHRAFDSLGAVLGPLIALLLLQATRDNMRLVFFLASVPAAFGVVLLILFVREKSKAAGNRVWPRLSLRLISPRLRLFLAVSFLFAAGNSSDAFLLLLAKNLGMTTATVVFVYVLYNVSQTVFAVPAGKLADRIGPRRVYAGGLLVFAAVYFLFGIVRETIWLWLLFPVYGVYIAATDGVSKAFISGFVRKEESATFFGLHQLLTALGGFLASFIGGLLWSKFGASYTMFYGSVMAIVALICFGFFDRPHGQSVTAKGA